MSTSTNLLQSFGIDSAAFDIIDNAAEFTATGRTTTLPLDVKVPFQGSVNGVPVEAEAILRSAKLVRISEMEHKVVRSGEEDRMTSVVSGVFRPTRLELFLKHKNEMITLAEFLRALVNEGRSEPVDELTFARTIAKMGMPLVDNEEYGIRAELPLLWQHFGANEDTVEHIFTIFNEQGATDAMPRDPGRIVRALQLSDDKALPVSMMELSSTDRTKSSLYGKTYDNGGSTEIYEGAGFLDLIDAQVGQFLRGFQHRKIRAGLKAQRDELKKSSNPAESEIRDLQAGIDLQTKLSTQWIANLGGSQQRAEAQPDGSLIFHDIYDPVNVPCGRMIIGVPVESEGEVGYTDLELNFWKNTQEQSTGSNLRAPVDTTGDDEEEPF